MKEKEKDKDKVKIKKLEYLINFSFLINKYIIFNCNLVFIWQNNCNNK